VVIARAGFAQLFMYGLPIVAVLVVVPTERIGSLGGLVDAMNNVFTVYGGAVADDGSVTLTGGVRGLARSPASRSSGCCWPAALPG
jgi:glutamate:GABA antiporter